MNKTLTATQTAALNYLIQIEDKAPRTVKYTPWIQRAIDSMVQGNSPLVELRFVERKLREGSTKELRAFATAEGRKQVVR